MRYSAETSISLPIDGIDLPDWLFHLSKADYAACSGAHIAVGVIGAEKRLGMVNVESIGGSLLVQHYATRRAEKGHITMVSEASDAYLLHLVPVKVGVTWDMEVVADGPRSSRLRCTVDVKMPTIIWLLGLTLATPWFLQRHIDEETEGFARDIARNASAS